MRVVGVRRLAVELERARSAELTYPDRGATAGELPAGYRHLAHRIRMGSGADVLDRAEAALLNWRAQSGSGMALAVDGPAVPDRTVVLGLGRPLALVIPCRVVWCLHTERRRGFAYGTLPGHPVAGEECFVLELDADDQVWLSIRAFSRPGARLVRWVGPLGRAVQRLFVRRYAAAIRRSVS
ncbi:MAG TPA: DUF1990 domain-containing protein [Sporichthya sp.]|nr:DUF1990 domain-containing protein [Sporichthya sp.]